MDPQAPLKSDTAQPWTSVQPKKNSRKSNTNQAKVHLLFSALQTAITLDNEANPTLPADTIIPLTHDGAIQEINKLAESGVFFSLAAAPAVISKFGDERFGTINEVKALFLLIRQKHDIKVVQGKSPAGPLIHKLYSEMMWVYMHREPNSQEIGNLYDQCPPSTETCTAYLAHKNKRKKYQTTISFYHNWPSHIPKITVTYKYYMSALRNDGAPQEIIQEKYQAILTAHPEYMNDAAFFADYIRFYTRSSRKVISPDELVAVEKVFEKYPDSKKQDKPVRVLLQAYFDAGEFGKAQACLTPLLTEDLLSKKTLRIIVERIAETNLPLALEIYKRKLAEINRAQSSIEIDLHKHTVTSYGTHKYGVASDKFVKIQLFYLHWFLAENFKKGKQRVKITIITGQGIDCKLKERVKDFLCTTFKWDFVRSTADSDNPGEIQLSEKAGRLNSSITLPGHLKTEWQ